MQKYIKAVENNICKMCIDSDDDGNCLLTEEENCAVQSYLPEIVNIVHEINSDNHEIIHKRLKEVVCTNCKARDEEGNCYLRENANCALDRYFDLIVETIKKVDAGKI
jgi:hypothetical protein